MCESGIIMEIIFVVITVPIDIITIVEVPEVGMIEAEAPLLETRIAEQEVILIVQEQGIGIVSGDEYFLIIQYKSYNL